MQLARRGCSGSLGHVSRGNDSDAHGDWFHGVRAAHRSGTHNVLIVASNPKVGEPYRYSGFLLSRRAHACCGVVSNGCCDVSATRAAVFRLSAAPLLPPNPAIACTS
jgi:hypothetical protein